MARKISKKVSPSQQSSPIMPISKNNSLPIVVVIPASKIKTSKKSEISEIIAESATDSTTHAIPHMFKRENPFLKAFWFICFLGATGVCAWMISLSITDYLNYETVSKTETIVEIPSKFPTVSICNMNAFMTNYSLQFIQDILTENGLYTSNTSQNKLETSTAFDYMQYRYFAGLNANALNESDRRRMGFNLDDIMISCTYNLEPCNSSEFEWYYDTLYGSCFKFNSGRNAFGQEIPDRISTKAGKINGLSIELFTDDPTDLRSLSISSGIHLTVHNKSVKSCFYEGFDLLTGMTGNVAVSRDFSSLIEQPYSNCIANISANPSVLAQSILNTNYNYRQSDCFDSCFQRYVVQQCKCHDLTAEYWPELNATACLTYPQVLCDRMAYGSFFSQDVNALCSAECPLECDSVEYSISTSFAEYPSSAYAEVLKKNKIVQRFFNYDQSAITYDALKRRIASFNVYYDELSYIRYIELEKTNLVELISSIGGTLGLFLGMSFLSFIEFIDLIIRVIIVLAKKQN